MEKEKMYELFTIWWNSLQNNNGGRAKLKRCRTPEEAALLPETHRLRSLLPQWIELEAVAIIAGVSAHIKKESKLGFSESLATPNEKKGRAPLSEERFRQLLSCREWAELYRSLRRTVTILDGNVNLINFFKTVILWNDEFHSKYKKPGKGIKFELSQSYYETAMKYEK